MYNNKLHALHSTDRVAAWIDKVQSLRFIITAVLENWLWLCPTRKAKFNLHDNKVVVYERVGIGHITRRSL